MVDASGTTTYTYDTRNRLLTKATPEGTLTYTYDASGNVASIDSSNANGTSVAYAWDAANQLASVTDNRLGGMTTAAYTATGRPSTLKQPNGVGVTYAYDSLDRVLSMAWKKGTSPALATFAYTYSPRGQRLTATDVTGRAAGYGYDTASRLTSETITGDPAGASSNGGLTYTLDPTGNRLSRASSLAALGAQSFSYDPNDELMGDSYDLNGNTINSGGHSYGYDFENRLVAKDGEAVVVVYDGDGHRVSKTVAGTTTKYLAEDFNPTGYLQVIEEVSGSAATVRYTHGDMLISQTRNASGAAETSFYGYDAHGNIAFLSDATGAETDTYTYDAWGNLLARTGGTLNTRLYAGEEVDIDLGTILLRARQYRPDIARFVTTDPFDGPAASAPLDRRGAVAIAAGTQTYLREFLEIVPELNVVSEQLQEPLGLGRYLYANGDAVNRRDPSGLSPATEAALLQTLAQTAISELLAEFVPTTAQSRRCARLLPPLAGGIPTIYVNRVAGFYFWALYNLVCYFG